MKTTLLRAALLSTLLAAFGCGAQSAPDMAHPGAGAFAARAVDWSKPVQLLDFEQMGDFDFLDAPKEGHPFAEPLRYRFRGHGEDGPVAEIYAPDTGKPVRGLGIIYLPEEEGGSFKTDKGLADRVKVNFRWANNTAVALQENAVPAQVVFVVRYATGQKDADGNEVTGLVAMGYAWANRQDAAVNLVQDQLYPPAAQAPLMINMGGDEAVPYRYIPKAFGNGLGQACGEAAFQKMELKPMAVDSLVRDVHAAFPQTYQTKLAVAKESPTDQAVEPPPETNRRLLGIVAVAFGANLPAGTCSHAILAGDVSFQRGWD